MSTLATGLAILMASGLAGAPGAGSGQGGWGGFGRAGRPTVTLGVPSAQGPVGVALVQRSLRGARSRLETCYRGSLKTGATPARARLHVRFRINRVGQVRGLRVAGRPLPHKALQACALRVLQGLGYPRAPLPTRVSLALDFEVRVPVACRLSLTRLTVDRGLSAVGVKAVLRRARRGFKACYGRYAHGRGAGRVGTVRLRLRVGRRGLPRAVTTSRGTLRSEAIRRCVARVARKLRFPRGRAGWVTSWLLFRRPAQTRYSLGGIGAYRAAKRRAILLDGAVHGGLTKAAVRAVLLKTLPQVQYCYQSHGLTRNPALEGKVKLSFTVRPTGKVGLTSISMSTLNSSPVESCIQAAARRWVFPRPSGAMPFVTWSYAFKRP